MRSHMRGGGLVETTFHGIGFTQLYHLLLLFLVVAALVADTVRELRKIPSKEGSKIQYLFGVFVFFSRRAAVNG